MKKKYFALLAVGLFSTSLLAPLSVFAAEDSTTTNPTPTVKAPTTTGDVTFNKPDDNVKPVDPTDPSKPGTDPDNPGTNQTGPLTLDAAPNLSFGTHDIASGSQTYNAVTPKTPFVQASDRRGLGTDGQAQGWNVTVAMSDFTNASKQVLPGASLAFASASVKGATTTQGTAPTSLDVASLSSASGATPLLKADKGQGAGTWVSVYDPNNIKLTVPQAAAGNFTSTLSWTINASPVQ